MTASVTTSREIPVIDLGMYMDGHAEIRKELARQVDAACRRTGFLLIVGHRIPDHVISGTYRVAREFFDLPVDDKMAYARPDRSGPGYRPYAQSALAHSRDDITPPDLKENFVIGPVRAHDGESDTANVWPDKPLDFRSVCTSYYEHMEHLAAKLLEVFAEALGVQSDFFVDKMDNHSSFLSIINYPEQAGQKLRPGQLRAGAHTDYGTLTILYKDQGQTGGLQVRSLAGGWIDVDPPPRSFVVNIGDLMARWTNDRWVSTMHRVMNPGSGDEAAGRRISIAFFNQPNPDARIAPIPTCVTEDRPAKYDEVTAGEYLRAKQMKVAAHREDKSGL